MVSNFRVLRRDVVDRICSSRTAHPYLTGQALLYSGNRANVSVRHEPRAVGASTYSFPRILALVLTILFSYSSWPLRTLALIGFGVAALSFVLGGVYLVLGLLTETRVEGWTTLVVLLAVFNGFTIGLLSMLGEYVVRTLNAVSAQDTYHVRRRVSRMTDHFLVIGAQRCGTTYLRTLLDEHPSIVMATPARPEPKVFLDDDVVRRGLEWYDATWFAGARRRGAARREVHQLPRGAGVDRPGARRARQPPDPRAAARPGGPRGLQLAAEHRARAGDPGPGHRTDRQPATDPSAWDPAVTSVSPYAYLERGRYAEHLRPWHEAFGDRVRVQFLEDQLVRPEEIAETYRWLGVDADVRPPSLGEQVNGSTETAPPLGSELRARLRDWFAESDQDLAGLLGRPVPWPTAT